MCDTRWRLCQVETPLEEATKYVALLQEHARHLADTHILSIEVYTRKGRFLKSLQAMKRAAAAAAQGDPALHRSAVRFLVELQDKRSSLDPSVEKVVALELADSAAWGIPGLDKSAADFNEAYIKAHATKSISHGVAAAWALLFVSKGDASKKAQAVQLVMSGDVGAASLSEAVAAKNTLKEDLGFTAEQLKAYCDKAAARFPLASALAAA